MNKIINFLKINKQFFVRFLMPVIIGIAVGIILKYSLIFNDEGSLFLIRVFAQISEVVQKLIEYFVPIMIIIYITHAVVNIISENVIKFIFKYFIVLVLSLSLCVFFSLGVAYLFAPLSIIPSQFETQQLYIDPFFYISTIKNLAFYAIIISLVVGISLNLFKYTKTDNSLNKIYLKSKIVLDKAEHLLELVIKYGLLNLIPIWIISAFAVSTFERGGGQIIYMDLVLSVIILIAQAVWIIINNFIASGFNTNLFKKLNKASTKIYAYVTSMAGLSTGAIIPTIIEEQEKIGFEASKAKFISVSSFNMPGSLISTIIFAYAIVLLNDLQLSFYTMLTFGFAAASLLVIAPALPGGPIATIQLLFTPILGFNSQMTSLFTAFYFRQGTSNASINNAADFYISAYLDNNLKEKTNEQFNNTIRNRTN